MRDWSKFGLSRRPKTHHAATSWRL